MLLRNEERQGIKRRNAEHVLYRLCRTVRNAFQAQYPAVTISVEQLFVDAVEWLDELLSVGGGAMERCGDLWNDLLEMYRERDGQRENAEASQVKVAMLFYLLMYCIASAGHAYYRGSLMRELFGIIHHRWQHSRCREMEQLLGPQVDLLSGEMRTWMMAYFTSERSLLDAEEESCCAEGSARVASTRQQDDGRLPLPEELDTERAQKYFPMAIEKGWMSFEQGRYTWHGVTKKGAATQLAYFCGKVYECRYSEKYSGNTGKRLPAKALQELFGVEGLHNLLKQAYKGTAIQQWRSSIDALFLSDSE